MTDIESTTNAGRTNIELVNDVDAADVDAANVDIANIDIADTKLITNFDETVFFDRFIELRVFNSFDIATLSFKSISLPLTSSKNVTVKVLIYLLKSGA